MLRMRELRMFCERLIMVIKGFKLVLQGDVKALLLTL